jgi:hypothetical protein
MADSRKYDKPALYQIRVQGDLEPEWSDWFDGMTISRPVKGETWLVGPVADQPALYGLLTKVMNLGLPLISVTRCEDQDDESRR